MSESGKKKKAEKGTEKNQNKTIIIIVAICAVIIIALVAVIAFLLGKKQGGKGDESSKREVAGSVRTIVDESSAEDVMAQMREEVAEGMFECQMSMNWSFENGQAESKDAYVANSVNNTHPIFFDVYLGDDEGEKIYSSPILPVGTNVTNIKLDKELPAGEYKATVMYTLLKDMDSMEEISNAGFVVTIKVLN